MRIGTFSIFNRVLRGIRANQLASVRQQEMLTSGQRILRPSDDPVGTARSLRLDRRIAEMGRFREAIRMGRYTVDAGAAALQDTSGVLAEARELLIQGMNGTLSQEDRETIAAQFDVIRDQLIELGNRQAGERYLFGGTETTREPFVEVTIDGRTRVVYRGNGTSQAIRAGGAVDVPITLPGLEAFGRLEFAGTGFEGLTGVAGGTTADEGTGYVNLVLRHDATNAGALGTVGIALVNGGADDTLLGSNALTVDPVAGTIQLGSGPAVSIPPSTSAEYADVVVTNELGGELHLDLTTWSGGAYAGTVVGDGSVSLDGSTFTALSFTETDLELRDEDLGVTLHIDATGVGRAGTELVSFDGTTNVFDLMQGIAEDLRNEDGRPTSELLGRLNQRLGELDRNHENVLVSAGTLGSRGERLAISDDHAEDVGIQLRGLLSQTRDSDLAEVAVELARVDTILQVAQASGARLMQTSLLNFIG